MGKLKTILLLFLVGIGIMGLIGAAGRLLSKKEEETATGKETVLYDEKDLALYFPDEGDVRHQFINECGQFTEYVNVCIDAIDSNELFTLLNQEALLIRAGRNVKPQQMEAYLYQLKKDRPGGRLIMKDVTYFGEKDDIYSPYAIITAVYAEPVEEGDVEYDTRSCKTIYLYVYADEENHISSFFFGDMENPGLGNP